jgi:hypothetical protein
MGKLALDQSSAASGPTTAGPAAKDDPPSSQQARPAATDFLFSDPRKPMLYMLLDLGVRVIGPRTRPVQVLRSLAADGAPSPASSAVWAIHARGHDAGVYGCVTALNANLAVTKFWAAIAPGDDEVGYRNDPKKTMRFRRVAEGYRYDVGDGAEQQPGREEVGDVADVADDDDADETDEES